MVELFIHGQVCLCTKQLQKLVKFLCGSDDKESAYNVRDLGSIHGLERSPGGGHGKPLHYSCLENPNGHSPGGLQSMGSQRVRHD